MASQTDGFTDRHITLYKVNGREEKKKKGRKEGRKKKIKRRKKGRNERKKGRKKIRKEKREVEGDEEKIDRKTKGCHEVWGRFEGIEERGEVVVGVEG